MIFGTKAQSNSRRNTISYTRDEKRQTLEEAMKAYEAVARQLKWADYYKLLKGLLYKLGKFNSGMIGSDKEVDASDQEKRVMKCICRVLDGFNQADIKDALEMERTEGD